MIDNQTIERIFAAANIVDVVGDFVTLKKKGVNYQACCPFHNEKTPSFVVSPSKGLFKCFGCGKGGNAVTFVMEHEGINYPEALKFVAKKYGIEVQERELSPEEVRKNDDRESMLVATGFAGDWFTNTLWETDEGASVGLTYFKERGFKNDTIRQFGLGYCPQGGDVFTQSALRAGYKQEFLISTGLTIKRDNGTYYDRFSERVIFPIHSVSGRVVGFGGRTLRTDKKIAKYLNSPESEIYHKSNELYGIYFAKKAITQEDACILVEGYTDVISMHQAGIRNVVASSGTSLTVEQIRLIKRFTKNITIIYDGDAAGIKASLRGIDLILKEGMNVRVVPLPADEDPDSFARNNNVTFLQDYVKSNQEDFIAFKTRILSDDVGNDPVRQAGLISDVVSSIAEIPDPIVRSVYIKDTSVRLGTDQNLIASEVAKKRMSHTSDKETLDFIRRESSRRMTPTATKANTGTEKITGGSSTDELEKELLKYLLKYGDRSFDFKEGKNIVSINVGEIIISEMQVNNLQFANTRFRVIYDEYIALNRDSSPEGDRMKSLINHPDPSVSNIVVDILTDSDNYTVSKMWKKHDIIVETESERLAELVPRAIMLYKSKAIEVIIRELNTRLSNTGLSEDELIDTTFKIAALNKERMAIAKKLSRLIL